MKIINLIIVLVLGTSCNKENQEKSLTASLGMDNKTKAYFRKNKNKELERIFNIYKEKGDGLANKEIKKLLDEGVKDEELVKLQDRIFKETTLDYLQTVDDPKTRQYYLEKLVKRFPKNSDYKQMLVKARQARNQERAEYKRKSIGAQPSKIGNYYFAVKYYLEKNAHDPDSIQMVGCTNVIKTSVGWETSCKFRGKNGFGAKVLNVKTFWINKGIVVGMK